MKKKLVLLVAVFAVMLASLVACVTPAMVKSVELDKGDFPEVIQLGENPDVSQMKLIVTLKSGKVMERNVSVNDIENYDISTIGVKTFTITYLEHPVTFTVAVVESKYLTITFDSMGGTPVAPIEVFYGEKAAMPVNPTREGYIFEGWHIAGGQGGFNWAAPVTENVTLEAQWRSNENLAASYLDMLLDYYYGIVKAKYSVENKQMLVSITNGYLALLNGETDFDTAKALYEEAVAELSEVDTYADMILAYVAEMNAEEYFEEDWNKIVTIAYDVALAINEYTAGAPTPEFMYLQAIENIEAVPTMEEDIELAEYEKVIRIRAFKAYVEKFDAMFYSEEGWEELLATVEAGIAAINEAVGTRAVVIAYLEAIEAVSAVERLSDEKLEALYELMGAYAEYQGIEYFEEDWALLEAIYEEAIANIRAYEAGAPNVATMCEQALAAMDKILTKAEDIEVGNKDKVIKIRALNVYVDGLVETNFSEESWAQIQSLRNEGIAAINAAVGTRAVAAAYAAAYEAIVAVAPHSEEVINALAALVAAFDEYAEEDYFEEDWATIVAIYEEAYEAIRNYEEGAPTVATILHTALEAMDKVVTKAEDIELAEADKAKRIRDLRNLVESLDETSYNVENWKAVLAALEEGIVAINEAVGTRAVAVAYAEAVEAINAIEKLPEEVVNAIVALKEAFNAYNEEDYFADQWAEIVAIYEEALEYILNYEGGAPTIEFMVKSAIDDMANVVTKAEDIELAKYEKIAKIRALENYVAELDKKAYSASNWEAIEALLAEGIAAINAAEGTKAVAEAYAAAIAAIEAVEVLQGTEEQNNAIAQLDKAMAELYKEEDYFAEQWNEIKEIYNNAVAAILEYEGGAPSLDKIVSDALKAMDKVVTKAEDIALAEYEKIAKIRDLENYVAELIASGKLSEQQISFVNEVRIKAIDAINAAEGTKAVADLYAEAIALIKQLCGIK